MKGLLEAIGLNIIGFVDRRSRLLSKAGQNLEDRRIEKLWRERVAANPKERARLQKQSLPQGGRQWRAPVGIPASPVRRAPEPTALERWLTAPGITLKQAD